MDTSIAIMQELERDQKGPQRRLVKQFSDVTHTDKGVESHCHSHSHLANFVLNKPASRVQQEILVGFQNE